MGTRGQGEENDSKGDRERGVSNAVQAACAGLALTGRQRQVLGLLLRGHANKDVARELGCSIKNAEYLVGQILRKAGCSNRLELVARVLERYLQGIPAS